MLEVYIYLNIINSYKIHCRLWGKTPLLMYNSLCAMYEQVSEVKWKSLSCVSDSLWLHGLYSPWNSPGQNTGVGSLSLLQGNFSTQGLNPGLLHCRWILYQLSHKGSPWISQCWLKGFSWFQQADIGMLPSEKLHQFTCQPNISILWIPRLLPTPFAFHNYTQPTVRMYYIKCLRGPCKIN